MINYYMFDKWCKDRGFWGGVRLIAIKSLVELECGCAFWSYGCRLGVILGEDLCG